VSSPAAGQPGRPTLVRAIGRWALTAAVVNGMIGSGIFGLPSIEAALIGAWSPVAHLLAAVGVLTIVLCFAEVASRFQDPGGPYLYADTAFHPFVGFQVGWLSFWMRAAGAAASLQVFADYLLPLLPGGAAPFGRTAAMAAVLGLVIVVNLVGVRPATWLVNVFTLAKVAPLLLLALLGFPWVRPEVLASQSVAAPDWGRAVLLLMFAYGGFEGPLMAAGEVRNPRRDTAFALLTALAAVAVLYTMVQLVVVGVVPHAAEHGASLASAFGALLGPAGAVVASLAALVSTYGFTLGTVLQSPRILFSMSDRGELPPVFAHVHPRHRTPDVAILTFSAASLLLAILGAFESNAALAATIRLVTYGVTCAALPVLRRRRGAIEPGFRLRGAAFFVPAGIGFCLWLLTTMTRLNSVIIAGLLVAGTVLRWAAKRSSAAQAGV
jgi:amino acid transporter